MEIIPAMVLYEGAAMLKSMDPRWRADQQKEIHAAGAEVAKEVGASGPTDDFKLGIELGLATARAVVAGSAEVLTHGADPNKIL